MVPKGWQAGKVCDVINGLEAGVSVNGEDRALLPEEMAVLKVSAVSYGRFAPSAAKAIQSDELERAKTNPRAGRIIISRSNTEELVGASAYIAKDYNHLFLSDKLWQTLPKQNADMEWLSYVLASSHSRFVLSSLATGTSGSMKNITKGELLGLKILIPPHSEQRKIAQILSTWDKAIATTERLLANKQQQKKALMQRLLTGKQRFAGFEGEWRTYKQGDVARFYNGRAYKLSEWEESGTPVIRLQNLTGRGSDYYYSNLELPNHQYCSYGDLLYMWSATFGPHIWKGQKAIYHYHIWKIECDEVVLNKTFMYYVLDFETQKWLLKSNGMGLLHITKETMEKQLIAIPSVDEQKKIAQVLTNADLAISKTAEHLTNLKSQKKALMQQLLTGKRRVKVDEAAA